MSFSDLKKQSKLGSLTSKLVKEVEKLNTNSNVDDRIWKPEMDKTGNGYQSSVSCNTKGRYSLGKSGLLQGPGGWYIENSHHPE